MLVESDTDSDSDVALLTDCDIDTASDFDTDTDRLWLFDIDVLIAACEMDWLRLRLVDADTLVAMTSAIFVVTSTVGVASGLTVDTPSFTSSPFCSK